jgi:hypothetical protein
MNKMTLGAADAALPTAYREMVWLLGQPHLHNYLDFVKHRVVGGEAIDQRLLADEWRAANDVYYELEKNEAGEAEKVGCRALPKRLKPLADALTAHPHYRTTFDSLPAELMMVELDRLILSQTHVTTSFTEGLRLRLGDRPASEDLFRFCLPLEREQAPVRIQRLGEGKYLFSSESTDFRPHEAVLLRPDQLNDPLSFGDVAAVVGLFVGYGSNFLTAIRSESRLLLQNGYHRAYALRSMGVTHAPCIVQEVTRRDELKIAACDDVNDDPGFYFRAARPPMLRDFFNPKLTKRLALRPMRTSVEVEFKMRSFTAVEL